VPVLSKQQVSTFPANGIRKGSVQKMAILWSAMMDWFTAIVSSIGNSGGMTEVMTSEQFRKSL
jgi:hypothetical protein